MAMTDEQRKQFIKEINDDMEARLRKAGVGTIQDAFAIRAAQRVGGGAAYAISGVQNLPGVIKALGG